MTQRTGRISCPKCGANNFDTVSACWKCGASFSAGNTPPAVSSAMPMPVSSGGQYGYTPERIPSQTAYGAAQPPGDPNTANRAAMWLALTLPFIGLPAGWLFMMVDDQRKQRVGRICVTWSLIALVFHIAFTVILLKSATSGLVNLLMPIVNSMAQKQQGGGGGLPGD